MLLDRCNTLLYKKNKTDPKAGTFIKRTKLKKFGR